jgi:carboxypeptidase Taq
LSDALPDAFGDLRARLAELDDLDHAARLLGWDQQTHMPPSGAPARGEAMATLERVHHERAVDPALGELLEGLAPWAAVRDPEDEAAAIARVARRDHDRARRVPADLTAELARASSEAMGVWVEAKRRSDFALLQPHLERIVELRRRVADCFPGADHPYDALLDHYEPGMTSAQVRAVFATLRPRLVRLIEGVAAAAPAPTLPGPFPVAGQRRLALEIVGGFGFEDAGWRIDDAEHPFCAGIAPGDIRVTSRFSHQDLAGVFAVLHEVGHGLYEQGVDPGLARTTMGTGVSLGIHESQSRLWENFVGRSRAFWEHWHPRALALFGDAALGGAELDGFLRAINAVRPGLIRVKADEVTYGLHVILRFELEVRLIEGDLAVADLPDAWSQGMAELLGVEVPDDAHGVLQDIHWAAGEIGYFPTYALGTIVAAQLWRAAQAAIGDLEERLARGDTLALREWLRERVHRFGRTVDPSDVVHRATGSALDPEPLLEHLEAKYGALYDVSGWR